MKYNIATIALMAAFACGSVSAMTKDEYKVAKDKIEATYKSDKQACDAMKDNAKDVCMKEAKGKENIAKAELEQGYKPSDKNMKKVSTVKADSAYDIAKEKCEDQKGDAEKTCKNSAKMEHDNAKKAMKG